MEITDMSIQKLGRIKRTIFILLVVGFLLSLTAGAVNAKSSKGTDIVAIKFVPKE
jgi:hypothetical protein